MLYLYSLDSEKTRQDKTTTVTRQNAYGFIYIYSVYLTIVYIPTDLNDILESNTINNHIVFPYTQAFHIFQYIVLQEKNTRQD